MSDFEIPILQAKELQRAVNQQASAEADTLQIMPRVSQSPYGEPCSCGWNRKGHCFKCEEHGPVTCIDCAWKGCACQLLAQACPVCDGRCADC